LGHNAIRFLFFFGSLRRSISRFRLRRGINYFVVILFIPRMDFVSSPVTFRWICENGPFRSREGNFPTSRSPYRLRRVVRCSGLPYPWSLLTVLSVVFRFPFLFVFDPCGRQGFSRLFPRLPLGVASLIWEAYVRADPFLYNYLKCSHLSIFWFRWVLTPITIFYNVL